MLTDRGPFVWTQLHVPATITVESARAALTALAATAGQPRLVLEALGRAGQVSWRLGCEASIGPRITRAIETHLTGLRTEQPGTASGDTPDEAIALRFHGGARLPLHTETAHPVTRSLLAALAQTRREEELRLQLILGPRWRPAKAPEVDRRDQRAATNKHAEHRFSCELRAGVIAHDPARRRTLLGGVAAALRSAEAPGVRLRVNRSPGRVVARAASPLMWGNHLSVSDLLPLTAWPIGEPPLPGVPDPHPVVLPPSMQIPQTGRPLGLGLGRNRPRPVALRLADSLRHLHVMGPTGVGKSTLMAQLALDDIEQGRGVVVIDPKGDLVSDLLARIPEARLDDVVVLDPTDPLPVGLDCFAGEPDLAADCLLAVFHSLYADSWGPRTHDILHACLLTLARRGDASLAMIPILLTHPGFRRSVIGSVVRSDPMGLGSFWGWFDAISDGERQAAIAPLMNKLRPILLRPGIRGVLAQRRPKFQLADVFTKRRILLVSLSKGRLGPEGAQLLGSLVVSLLWNAALGRIATDPSKRVPVMVHVDEVQDYLRLPGDLGDALAQARGLGVGFTLAHQHLGQLTPAIRDAIGANARSHVFFQLGARDAREVAKTTRGEVLAEDFEKLPAFHAYASLLVDGSPAPWTSLTTRPLETPTIAPTLVRQRSSASYGQPLTDIEADLLALTGQATGQRTSDQLGRTLKRSSGSEPHQGGRP